MSKRREKWLVDQRVVSKPRLMEIAPTVRVLPNVSAGSVGQNEVQTSSLPVELLPAHMSHSLSPSVALT